MLRSQGEAILQQAMELTVIVENQYCRSRAYSVSVGGLLALTLLTAPALRSREDPYLAKCLFLEISPKT